MNGMLAWIPGPMELLVLCVLGLLIFGGRQTLGPHLGSS